jgi:hypothetical protein
MYWAGTSVKRSTDLNGKAEDRVSNVTHAPFQCHLTQLLWNFLIKGFVGSLIPSILTHFPGLLTAYGSLPVFLFLDTRFATHNDMRELIRTPDYLCSHISWVSTRLVSNLGQHVRDVYTFCRAWCYITALPCGGISSGCCVWRSTAPLLRRQSYY